MPIVMHGWVYIEATHGDPALKERAYVLRLCICPQYLALLAVSGIR